MERNELIRRVKKGESLQQIRTLYFFNLLARFPSTSRFLVRRGENLMHYIYLLKDLGFMVIDIKETTTDSNQWNERATSYHLVMGEFHVRINWDSHKGKDDLGFFSIVFTTPDKENHELGGYHIKVVDMIQNTIENWDEWMREWYEIEKEIPKIKKMTDIANNTIDTVIPAIMKQHQWEYAIEKKSGDTILKIKMSYHRCIEIKILPTMDLSKLFPLFDLLPKVWEIMTEVGNFNVTVKNYGNDFKWSKNF